MWHLYILKSESTEKYYIGISESPFKRLKEHNSELNKGYTSKGRPWNIVGLWQIDEQASAVKIERFIKKQKSSRFLERLLGNEELTGILAHLVRVPHLRD